MRMWIAGAALALCACGPLPSPSPPVYVDDCAAACARLDELGCGETSTPAGTSCDAWCRDTEATGYTTMHPECIAVADTCEEAARVSAEGCE